MRWGKLFNIGVAVAVVTPLILEVALRIHDPFHFNVKRGRIVLPANKTYTVDTLRTRAPDRVLLNHRNSLGLRGEEPPANPSDRFMVVTMGGGSTAENGVTDGKTWTDQLGVQLRTPFRNIWINNAGFAGHTTVGNLIMLEDLILPLAPKVVVFQLGVNDIEVDKLGPAEADMIRGRYDFTSAREFAFSASRNLEVVALVANLIRARSGHRTLFGNAELNFNNLSTLDLSPEKEAVLVDHATSPYLPLYRNRVKALAAACQAKGVIPIFLTQPVVYGVGRDDVTGADLELMMLGPEKNGRVGWKILERYNDQLRALAATEGLTVIDLARMLPKSSRYFFAPTLYTEEGSAEVARLIAPGIVRIIGEK